MCVIWSEECVVVWGFEGLNLVEDIWLLQKVKIWGYLVEWSDCAWLCKMDHVVGGKFKLGRKIGSGSFGELYLGTFNLFVC